LFEIAPKFKHPSFSEEKEWRLVSPLVQTANSKMNFRAGTSMLIPYRNFSLEDKESNFSPRKIFVGPTPHKDLSISSEMHLLFSRGISDCSVAPSIVPFRNW